MESQFLNNPQAEITGFAPDSKVDLATKLKEQADVFRSRLYAAQETIGSKEFAWYPYDTLAGFSHFDATVTPPYRDIRALSGNAPILDVGCADGATSFLLASLGFEVDAIDYAQTNYNGMRGIRALSKHFRSKVNIYSVDLDAQFRLPQEHYGLVLFLGILYHLKNPYFAMERLAHSTRYCFLSTRVARFDPAKAHWIETVPVAYLVSPTETNNDSTNYWIFSRAGLCRLFERTGWEVCSYRHVGNTEDSDPASSAGDERVFCLLKSKHWQHEQESSKIAH